MGLIILLLGISTACSPPPTPSSTSFDNPIETQHAALAQSATAEKSGIEQTAIAFASTLTSVSPGTPLPTKTSTAAPTQSTSPTATEQPDIELEILETVYYVDYERILVLALIANHTPAALLGSQYQLALYDEKGTVIQASTGIIDFIPAGETIALADVLLTPRKTQYAPEYHGVAGVDLQITGSILTDHTIEDLAAGGTLAASDAVFFASDYFPKVTGTISSGYSVDLVDIPVIALLYDKDDAIVGGGFTYIPFIPAGKQSPVEIGVIATGKTERVELIPRLSIYSISQVSDQ
jgi:hypothetical protein